MKFAATKTKESADTPDLYSQQTQSNILNLLLSPIRIYFSIFTPLALPNYGPLFSVQSYLTRRAVAREVAQHILRKGTLITSRDNLQGVLEVLKVLIREGMQQSVTYPGFTPQRRAETEETIEEQGWLARIVHYIQGPDNDTQLQVRQSCFSLLT